MKTSEVLYSNKDNYIKLVDKCPSCDEIHSDLEVLNKKGDFIVLCPNTKEEVFIVFA